MHFASMRRRFRRPLSERYRRLTVGFRQRHYDDTAAAKAARRHYLLQCLPH